MMRIVKNSCLILSVGGLCMTSGSVHAAVAGAIETWDVDLAGWDQSTTASTVVWAGGGGNPDGHVQIRRIVSGPNFDVGTATTLSGDFLGDYGIAGVGGVALDVNAMTDNITGASIRFRPDVVDNGWSYSFANALPLNTWASFTVEFNPNWDDVTAMNAGWIKDDPTVSSFSDLFSSVGWAEVRFASSQESTLAAVDNFELLSIPEPSTWALLLVGASALALRRRRH